MCGLGGITLWKDCFERILVDLLFVWMSFSIGSQWYVCVDLAPTFLLANKSVTPWRIITSVCGIQWGIGSWKHHTSTWGPCNSDWYRPILLQRETVRIRSYLQGLLKSLLVLASELTLHRTAVFRVIKQHCPSTTKGKLHFYCRLSMALCWHSKGGRFPPLWGVNIAWPPPCVD